MPVSTAHQQFSLTRPNSGTWTARGFGALPSGDNWLRGLFVESGEPTAAHRGKAGKPKGSSGRQRGVAKWFDAGRPMARALVDLGERVAMLRELEAGYVDGALVAEPAAELVVREELVLAERRHAARRDAPEIAAHVKTLKRKLYHYQEQGVARFLEERRLLLADDMGLGKTT